MEQIFRAIARVIEAETGIPTFSVPTNGMHDYVYGAGIALEKIAERFAGKTEIENDTQKQTSADKSAETETTDDSRFPDSVVNVNPKKKEKRSGRSVNLLGVTPLDFGPQKNVEIMKENLYNYGWNVLSAWAMGDTLETLQQAGTADVNLVVSAVGLRAAKVLQEKFGTPYVIGTPNEWLAETISEALEEAAEQQTEQLSDVKFTGTASGTQVIQKCGSTENTKLESGKFDRKMVYLQNRMQKEAEITLIGEPVTMGSLAAGIEKKYGHSVRVFCPLKECENLVGEKDAIVLGEEAMEEALRDAKIIVADPLYKPICPAKCTFYELPHVAFSGRLWFGAD